MPLIYGVFNQTFGKVSYSKTQENILTRLGLRVLILCFHKLSGYCYKLRNNVIIS